MTENNSADEPVVSNLPTEADIAHHVTQIQKRRLGYNFGGPELSWCKATTEKGIALAENPDDTASEVKTYTGCLKYSTCNIIPEELRWVKWEDLSERQQGNLKELRCYRATRGRWQPTQKEIIPSDNSSGWDVNALPSRQEADKNNQWIGNPFGVRTQELGKIAQEVKVKSESEIHRDLAPCSVGGCVTPEMQRDYSWERKEDNTADDFWENAEACPFFFKHTNIDLSVATPNPQRFTQCYVTLPELRENLEKLGIVVVAPVFRTFAGDKANYTYTFYSGSSFLQLPTRAPEMGNSGWLDRTLPLKWQATAAMRGQPTEEPDHLPIGKLFEDAEQGRVLAPWEREARVISVSEGQSTSILLQWVLMRRMSVLLEEDILKMDVVKEIEWNFDNEGIIKKLRDWGYETNSVVSVDERGMAKTTLYQDLQMLGIFDTETQKPTERLKSCAAWLQARYEENAKIGDDAGYRNLLKTWLIQDKLPENLHPKNFDLTQENAEILLWKICWLFIFSAVKDIAVLKSPGTFSRDELRKIQIQNFQDLKRNLSEFESENFREVCRLIPPMHAIVRAKWKTPLRWLFVPLAEGDFDNQSGSVPRLYNGLIVIIEDDPEMKSLPYTSELSVEQDSVLKRLRLAMPLLTMVSDIEEGYVRYAFDFLARNREYIRVETTPEFEGFVLASDKIQEIWNKTLMVGRARNVSVFISGETGTGKGMVAKAIHQNTPSRKDRKFVKVNCSAIPDELIESELFGHAKGSFTGAVADKKGVFEIAEGGTIFLDEIGEMKLDKQSKLLHAIEDRKFTPIGKTEQSYDIRIIGATNRDPMEAIKNGYLREDIYYRLKQFEIEIPPLHERSEEIPALAKHFVNKTLRDNFTDYEEGQVEISAEVLAILEKHHWQGNVRELEDTIIEATVRAVMDGSIIKPEHLPSDLQKLNRIENFPQTYPLDISNCVNETGNQTLTLVPKSIEEKIKQVAGGGNHNLRNLEILLLGDVKKGVVPDEALVWEAICWSVSEICTNQAKTTRFARQIGGLLLQMSESILPCNQIFLERTILDALAKHFGKCDAFPEAKLFDSIKPCDPSKKNCSFNCLDSSKYGNSRKYLADLIIKKFKEVKNL